MGNSLFMVQVSLEPGFFPRVTPGPEEQVTRPGDSEPGKERAPESMGEAYRKAAPYMSAATSLVGAVAGLTLLGVWIDRKMGNRTPWFTLAGALLGMVSGFVSFFRQVLGKGKGR
jgi:F0F1-type ATP synthase assembly protein I